MRSLFVILSAANLQYALNTLTHSSKLHRTHKTLHTTYYANTATHTTATKHILAHTPTYHTCTPHQQHCIGNKMMADGFFEGASTTGSFVDDKFFYRWCQVGTVMTTLIIECVNIPSALCCCACALLYWLL